MLTSRLIGKRNAARIRRCQYIDTNDYEQLQEIKSITNQ